MALSRLARLALNSVSDSPPHERAETCRLVATALTEECPDLASLATRAAFLFHQATETEADLVTALTNQDP